MFFTFLYVVFKKTLLVIIIGIVVLMKPALVWAESF